ncbi:MAG: DUF2191 domain-containing protein [Acidobacteria bacterium]|nr:MAG: DUF2191 domain-containing protein [Acidobacteriota bacterium]
MSRTTLDLSDDVLREAKKRAAAEGKTLREIVETALRGHLGGKTKRGRYALRWRSERGRLRAGVRIDDRDALLDLMEGRR